MYLDFKKSKQSSPAYRLALVPLLLSLASCGGGGDDNNPSTGGPSGTFGVPSLGEAELASITNDQAKSSALDSVSKNFGGKLDDVNGVSTGSSALSSMLNSITSSPIADVIPTQGTSSPVDGIPLPTDSQSTSDTQFEDDFGSLLDSTLATGSRESSSRVVYTPNPAEFCSQSLGSDIVNPDSTDAFCQDIVSHISVVQTLQTQTQGILEIKYDALTPVTIGYAETELYVEFNIGDLAAAERSIETIVDPTSTPSYSASGVVRATFSGDSTAASLVVAITQDISITGDVDSETTFNRFSIAAAPELFKITANDANGTGTVSVNAGAIDVDITETDSFSATTTSTAFSIAAITSNLSITDGGNTLVATNVGIGGRPLTLSIDGEQLFSASLATFGYNVNGTTEALTLTSALDLDATLAQTSSLSIDAPSNTMLSFPPTFIVGVDSGSLQIQTSGDVNGSVTVGSGQCLTDAGAGDFPFVAVACQ